MKKTNKNDTKKNMLEIIGNEFELATNYLIDTLNKIATPAITILTLIFATYYLRISGWKITSQIAYFASLLLSIVTFIYLFITLINNGKKVTKKTMFYFRSGSVLFILFGLGILLGLSSAQIADQQNEHQFKLELQINRMEKHLEMLTEQLLDKDDKISH